ncbi:hypothetical protein [Arthrobacter sp. TE12232]
MTEIRDALPALSEAAAEDLLLTIVTLCHAWVSSPNVALVTTGTPYEERRRAAIMRTCELLAQHAAGAG